MLVFTLAAATFMFTGPVGRGTGRELGARARPGRTL